MRIAKKAPDDFSALLAAGISSLIIYQAFINIAAISGLIPLTGLTLPLISYGSSSYIVTLLSLGILFNISCYTKRAI
jgi:cell division protein FtsW